MKVNFEALFFSPFVNILYSYSVVSLKVLFKVLLIQYTYYIRVWGQLDWTLKSTYYMYYVVPNQCSTKKNILPVAITLWWGGGGMVVESGTRLRIPSPHRLGQSLWRKKLPTLYT